MQPWQSCEMDCNFSISWNEFSAYMQGRHFIRIQYKLSNAVWERNIFKIIRTSWHLISTIRRPLTRTQPLLRNCNHRHISIRLFFLKDFAPEEPYRHCLIFCWSHVLTLFVRHILLRYMKHKGDVYYGLRGLCRMPVWFLVAYIRLTCEKKPIHHTGYLTIYEQHI